MPKAARDATLSITAAARWLLSWNEIGGTLKIAFHPDGIKQVVPVGPVELPTSQHRQASVLLSQFDEAGTIAALEVVRSTLRPADEPEYTASPMRAQQSHGASPGTGV